MALTKHLVGASALVVGAAVALSGTAAAQAGDDDRTGSAFGLAAKGPVAIQPLPAVASTGKRVHKSLLPKTANGLVSASALEVLAEGRHAHARAADVSTLQEQVKASAVSARCEGGRGVSNLAHAVVAGREVDSSPAPNTTIPVDIQPYGKGSVTFNKQYRMADGKLSVTGMAVTVPLPEGKTQTIDVASVTCGTGRAEEIEEEIEDTDASSTSGTEEAEEERDVSTTVSEEEVAHEAPAPAPAKADLPVAG